MKKLITAAAVLAALYVGLTQFPATNSPISATNGPINATPAASEVIGSAFRDQRSGIQVEGDGVVAKVLSDDNDGSRHQRFILRLSSGQTLLVAHNIDIAPRIASLESGDRVQFKGVYEWNSKGGVIHWTHRDPSGEHQAGWLRHNGETYQ
jgi:hypothetical protein